MTGRLYDDERGTSLTELMVAVAVAAILGAVMLVWLTGVTATEQFQEQEQAVLDQMRAAKGRMVKELRFADTIDPSLPEGTMLTEIVFADGADVITWTIDANGTLWRDDGSGTPSQHATGLVVGSSGFTIRGDSVTIDLVADVDATEGPSPRSIRTEVFVRN